MERSNESIEFENAWKGIRTAGVLIPDQTLFRPEHMRKFLASVALVEIDIRKKSLTAKLVGENVRRIIKSDIRGMDINAYAPKEQLPIRLERQKAYHDHPVGKVDTTVHLFEDGTEALHEITYLPLWGRNGERILIVYYNDRRITSLHQIDRTEFVRTYTQEEQFIDIGAGVPDFEHHL